MKTAKFTHITVALLLLALLVTPALSQDAGEFASGELQPRLVDEFGPLGECDLRARFDSFLLELQQNPSMSGYAIFYNGRDVLPAFYESPAYERLFVNHVSFRRFDRNRITVVRGGFGDSVVTQLWLVPPGAEPPSPENSEPTPALPDDRAFKFDQRSLTAEWEYDNPFVLEAVKQRERNELARDLGDNAGEVFESIDNAADVGDEEQFYWFSKEFGGYLSLRSDLKGVIIFYADEQRYDIAKLTNHIDAAVSSFEQDGQRLEGRVDIVFGGYRSWPVAEFFIYPPGAVFPEPTPDEREIESSDLEY